jgi:hypothetical protein
MRRPVLLAVVLLVLAACNGAPEGREPRAWAAETCANLQTWMVRLQTLSEEYTDELGGLEITDRQEAADRIRDRTVAFMDDAIEATDRLVTQLEGSGTPAVEDGEEVVDTFRGGITGLRDAFVDARDRMADATPGNVEQRLTEVGTAIQEAGQRAENLFDRAQERDLGGEELSEAFEAEPACRGLADDGA